MTTICPDEADRLGAGHGRLRLGVAIATTGRAPILRETLRDLGRQSRLPDRVLVCHAAPSDIAGIEDACLPSPDRIQFIASPPGLPRQRNALLDMAQDVDILLFIDDDFLMARRSLEAIEAIFATQPMVVAATGALIHDDARGPGLTVAAGQAMIAADEMAHQGPLDRNWSPASHAYGCNMAVRLSAVRAHALRFDERLPLYGWSEDMDFSHRIARHGTIAKLEGARGVHLGAKCGRASGRRLGYSQVANPLYLWRKGSYTAGRASRSVGRNIAANLWRAVSPEPWIDRRGRLLGNALACLDLVRGRLRPERVLEL